MACDGVGPSFTCLQLCRGIDRAGQKVEVFAIRRRTVTPRLPLHLAFPGPLNFLPFQKVARNGQKWIEQRYLSSIREGDIAYCWPAASLETHQILHARGIPIVLEGINTRMSSAKRILDDAYAAFDVQPAHSITEARIAEEEAKFQLASAIFAPSQAVEAALKDSPIMHGIFASSYGVDTSRGSSERDYRSTGRPLTFMFCGYAGVRKGIHHLLNAWQHVPSPHRLRIVGRIEPLIAERYRDILASDRVELAGFVKNVHAQFAKADVFIMPSLEEGDPLVTYEAALHGLPIIASPMGAGRMGDVSGVMITVDPGDVEGLARALTDLAVSDERRAELGIASRKLALTFDWDEVGKKRTTLLYDRFGN